MIHGYHVILPMYGFWLPNDPRGSWSDFVWKWEIARFGKATISLERRDKRHPLARFIRDDGTMPRPWAESHWKVYLDSEQQIETAIRYVAENPEREGKQRQYWSFVKPFGGLEKGGHITCV